MVPAFSLVFQERWMRCELQWASEPRLPLNAHAPYRGNALLTPTPTATGPHTAKIFQFQRLKISLRTMPHLTRKAIHARELALQLFSAVKHWVKKREFYKFGQIRTRDLLTLRSGVQWCLNWIYLNRGNTESIKNDKDSSRGRKIEFFSGIIFIPDKWEP